MGGVFTAQVCSCEDSGAEVDGAEVARTEVAGGPPDLFVDGVAEVIYELDRCAMKLSRDGAVVLEKIDKVDFDGNIIRVPKGTKGFKESRLLRIGGPTTECEDDWFSVAKAYGRELSNQDFREQYGGRRAVHIKGFDSGMADVYGDNIAERLEKFEVLAWDGEDYSSSGFTRLVPLYLNTNPRGVAVAFKRRFEVPRFNYRWHTLMVKHPGRIVVVVVDENLDARELGALEEVPTYCKAPSEIQRRAFLLARVGLKTTGAAEVLALGGEGSIGWEAQASFPDEVHWTVFAVSRGQKEQRPSLCDFARKTLMKGGSGAHVHLVMGRDPGESDAFCREF